MGYRGGLGSVFGWALLALACGESPTAVHVDTDVETPPDAGASGVLEDGHARKHLLLRPGGVDYDYPAFATLGDRIFVAYVEHDVLWIRSGPVEGPWDRIRQVETEQRVGYGREPHLFVDDQSVIVFVQGSPGTEWHRFDRELGPIDDGTIEHASVEAAFTWANGHAAVVETWNALSTFRIVAADGPWTPLGWCETGAGRPHVVWTGAGYDVLLACDGGDVTYVRLDANGTIAAGPQVAGTAAQLDGEGASGLPCSRVGVARDGSGLLAAVPTPTGTELRLFDPAAGDATGTTIGVVPPETMPVGSYQMAVVSGRVLILAEGCSGGPSPGRALCSFERDDPSVVTCQEIHRDIETTSAYLVDGSPTPAFVFLQSTTQAKNTPFAARIEDVALESPLLARSVQEAPADETGLMVDCDPSGGACRVLSMEMNPDEPRPREARGGYRPVQYHAIFETEAIDRVPVDMDVWQRTAAALPGVIMDQVAVLDWGTEEFALVDDEGVVTSRGTSKNLNFGIPLVDGFLAWTFNLSACRYGLGGETIVCVPSDELARSPSTSDWDRRAPSRCGDDLYVFRGQAAWNAGEPTIETTSVMRVDPDTLTLSAPVLTKELFNAAPFSPLPAVACSGSQFVLVEDIPDIADRARVHRFSLDGHALGSAELVDWPDDATVEMSADEAGNVVFEQSGQGVGAIRREMLVVPPEGDIVSRVTDLPEPGSRHAVAHVPGGQAVVWSAEETGDLWLSCLPFDDPDAAGPLPETEPDDPPVGTPPPEPACTSGVLVQNDVRLDTLRRLDGCEMLLGNLSIVESNLTDVSILSSLRVVSGTLSIERNAELRSLTGLERLERVGGLSVSGNPVLDDVSALAALSSVGPQGIGFAQNALLPAISLPSLEELVGTFTLTDNAALGELPPPLSPLRGIQSATIIGNELLPECVVAAWIAASGVTSSSVCGNLTDACGEMACPLRL